MKFKNINIKFYFQTIILNETKLIQTKNKLKQTLVIKSKLKWKKKERKNAFK